MHLGCGGAYKDGWINIDLESPGADLLMDLTNPFPYEGDSVSFIYTEHFLEHIGRSQAVDFLRECRRVLRDGGVLRISTPNLAFLVECYRRKNIAEWGDLWAPDSPCNLMNEGMRSWGHTYLYDFDELVRVLAEAGFSVARRSAWGESVYPDLKGLETRPYHKDLIVEVVKGERAVVKKRKWLFS